MNELLLHLTGVRLPARALNVRVHRKGRLRVALREAQQRQSEERREALEREERREELRLEEH